MNLVDCRCSEIACDLRAMILKQLWALRHHHELVRKPDREMYRVVLERRDMSLLGSLFEELVGDHSCGQ